MSYPSFLTHEPASGNLATFTDDFGCLATTGTDGCHIEQPLEAALKALTPATSDLRFADGTRGQGDRGNEGFRRDDAVLGIVIVTDEDDCSISDPELFDPEGPYRYESSELRCTQHEEGLHSVARYVEGFRDLVDDPAKLVVAAIAGVPTDLISDLGAVDYDAVLEDPRMEVRVDRLRGEQLLPACDVLGRVSAAPARRLLQMIGSLGENGIAQSICQETFLGALGAIIDRLGRAVIEVECF